MRKLFPFNPQKLILVAKEECWRVSRSFARIFNLKLSEWGFLCAQWSINRIMKHLIMGLLRETIYITRWGLVSLNELGRKFPIKLIKCFTNRNWLRRHWEIETLIKHAKAHQNSFSLASEWSCLITKLIGNHFSFIPDHNIINMTKRKKPSVSSNKMSCYVWLIFLLKQLSIGTWIIDHSFQISDRVSLSVLFGDVLEETRTFISLVLRYWRWRKVARIYEPLSTFVTIFSTLFACRKVPIDMLSAVKFSCHRR